MRPSSNSWMRGGLRRRMAATATTALLVFFSGCGAHAGFATPPAISVTLPISTVRVTQNGSAIIIPIQINSTSETALVMVSGLPGGIAEKYAASDTSPSGILTFTADASAKAGTYMPIVNVQSAGAMASASFTLIVQMQ